MKTTIGIVVIAYNRVKAVQRLVESLLSANYDDDRVDLIISVDFSGDDKVAKFANQVDWPHGEKIVIIHEANLGLKQHVLKCGELTQTYENICVFEDDIFASPAFYNFSKQAISFFMGDDRVAGISLYNHLWNPYVNQSFQSADDGSDAYLLQVASSWGQIWSRKGWNSFVDWMNERNDRDIFLPSLPVEVSSWSKKSWLKFHNAYLVDKNKYFVYPRVGLSTNFSDVGEHAASDSNGYQVPIMVGLNRSYDFRPSSNALHYDAFFESQDTVRYLNFKSEEIDIALYGNRPAIKRYRLTMEPLNNKIIKSWGLKLRPVELNIQLNINGHDIFLYDLSVTEVNKLKKPSHRIRRFLYDVRTNSKKDMLLAALFLYWDSIKRKFKC